MLGAKERIYFNFSVSLCSVPQIFPFAFSVLFVHGSRSDLAGRRIILIFRSRGAP